MAQIEKIVLVEHSAQEMFSLVDRVEEYPEFLPWCGGTSLIERTDSITLAAIKIDYHGVKQSFTTKNLKDAPEWMHIELQEGPFKHLKGHWHFKPLGDTACKIEFRLEYEFSNKILQTLIGPVFTYIANTFVEAFVHRAEIKYKQK